MPKVTIAIPTYNRPVYLAETLKSLLKQTFSDFQIIVFDDKSDFSAPDFLRQFNDPRISFLRSEFLLGGNAKNFQRICNFKFKTEYVMIFHDDDCLHPEALKRQVEILGQHPEISLVLTGMKFVSDFSKMFEFENLSAQPQWSLVDKAGFTRLILRGVNIPFNSALYRADIIKDIAPFQEKYGKWCDRPYMISSIKDGKAAFLKEILVNYRIHPGQDSQGSTNPKADREFARQLFSFYKLSLPEPLAGEDKNLFYSFSTNNLISFLQKTAPDFSSYKQALNEFKPDLFDWKYLRLNGLWYLIKALKRYFL